MRVITILNKELILLVIILVFNYFKVFSMKNITNKIFVLIIVISSLFASCEFLEIDPLDSYTENSVFSDLALAEAYVTRNYILPVNGFNSTALRFVSDESHNNFNWGGAW